MAAIDAQIGKRAWSRQQIARMMLAPDFTFRGVAERAQPERLIAFFVVEDTPEHLYVANIAVDAAFHRRGVGSFALGCVDEIARSLRKSSIVLHVEETNLAAQLLYRKCGYLAEEVQRAHYSDQDAYRMRKRLAPSDV